MTPTAPLAHDRAGPSGGLPVVLVHAGIADRRMWEAQWGPLTGERDAVRVDLRGFGESATPPEGALLPLGDLSATLDALGIARCHLVGASLGAGVAVELALTRPDLVESLLLAPPGGSLLTKVTPDLRAFFDAESAALERHDLDAATEANVRAWVVGPGRDDSDVPAELLTRVRTMQRRAFDLQLAWGAVEEAELDPPAAERLAEVAARTLVLVGDHDLETTREAAQRVAREVPGARLVEWTDAAHLPSMEHPDDFCSLLLEWVR
ncbi:MAG TPA: alpha/beta fold hydrolase, partial [Marmoricola sp.]|nr:alpha/beta fold hydrolase [Marmoricola sp.]